MMQPELLMPTWPNYNFACSPFDQKVLYDQEMDLCVVDDCDFSYSFITSPQDSSVLSSNSCIPAMILDEYLDLKDSCNEFQTSSAMDGMEIISRGDIEGICEWINGDGYIQEDSSSHDLVMEGDDGWSPSLSSDSHALAETDAELTLIHLMRAYGEAEENGERELGEVLVGAINGKSSPLGSTSERVAYNLFGAKEGRGEENLMAAFRVMYQGLPNGRLAHFTANAAILDSIPDDVGMVQIVDFDMGEGIQWPPLMEALGRKGKAVRITSLRREEECTSSCWRFEDTKKRLLSQGKQCGVKLQVEEKSVEEVGVEMLRMKREGQGRDWVVFNCMVGLPHMGRRRPRASVEGFLKEGKAMLAGFGGIVVLGDGEARDDPDGCCSYASYFDSMQRHYQGVFESLERNFPVYLAEARAAMESLFLGPLMCPVAWFRDWEETRKGRDFHNETQLEGRKLRLDSLVEAKEMVVEGENSYSVKIEGVREHEMVLRWKETPLVRVSTWI
ncbi:protein NODULATION SIGNALING PATHWAY 2-like [Salvia miltiorrhiza]|uniref:protein NODULATION SIGNALING PATHWAY 2-like n=1 Tax=Salvia miltiorrhiza TaxID=226208 RepID=UPI0025AC61A5|nr:protein NODULATION SIGNALING PATHWAY 2-like [Salvia miltiorrhiza]